MSVMRKTASRCGQHSKEKLIFCIVYGRLYFLVGFFFRDIKVSHFEPFFMQIVTSSPVSVFVTCVAAELHVIFYKVLVPSKSID